MFSEDSFCMDILANARKSFACNFKAETLFIKGPLLLTY